MVDVARAAQALAPRGAPSNDKSKEFLNYSFDIRHSSFETPLSFENKKNNRYLFDNVLF